MAKKPVLVDIDLNKNEVQNAVVQNLAATPTSPKAGQIWYNTTDNLIYFYNGTAAKAVGYLPVATGSTLGGVIVGNNISVDGTGKISVASATNAVAGIIRIATDAEASTGTAEGIAVNPKQLASAIATALAGGLIYKGTWDITSATDYSGITLPVKQGYMYLVTGTGPKTIGGVEWNSGDYIIMNADVAAGGTITNVGKIDNTEGSDIVRLNSTQTLTNKTIAAGNNTISGLGTSNFASGAIVTSVGSTGSDTALPTEKAVRSAITTATTNMVTTTGTQTLTNKTIDADDNTVSDLTTSNFKTGSIVTSIDTTGSDSKLPTEKAVRSAITSATSGMVTASSTTTFTNKTIDGDDNTIKDLGTGVFKSGVLQTTVRGISSASDSCLATEKAISTALSDITTVMPKYQIANNPSLTASSGVCTWTVSHTTGLVAVTCSVREYSTGNEVACDITYGNASTTIKINSTSNIAANTYKAYFLVVE